MPNKIREFSKRILIDPEEIRLAVSKPAAGIDQQFYLAYDNQKLPLLAHLIKNSATPVQSMVLFTSRKSEVNSIVRALSKLGYDARGISSDLEQDDREIVLRDFKNKAFPILVATDVLSRGIDIDNLTHVVNYDIPARCRRLRSPDWPNGAGCHHRYSHYVHQRSGSESDYQTLSGSLNARSKNGRSLKNWIWVNRPCLIPSGSVAVLEIVRGVKAPLEVDAVEIAVLERGGRDGRRGSNDRRRPENGNAPTGERRENRHEPTERIADSGSNPEKAALAPETPVNGSVHVSGQTPPATIDGQSSDKPKRRKKTPSWTEGRRTFKRAKPADSSRC